MAENILGELFCVFFFSLFGDFLFWSENEKQNTVRKLKNSDAQIGQLVCSFTQLTSRMKIMKMQQKFYSNAPIKQLRIDPSSPREVQGLIKTALLLPQ
jgi:hypothetical protein